MNIDPVQEAINNMDLSKLTVNEVVNQLSEECRKVALHLAVAASVLEVIQQRSAAQPTVGEPIPFIPALHPADVPPPAPATDGGVDTVVS